MKPTHALSWLYLGLIALLCLAVAVRHPMVDTSSTAQDGEGEGIGLLIWILVSVSIGMLHDQRSVLTAPRINPWMLVLALTYALLVVGGVWWIGTWTVTSSRPSSPVERVVGVSFAWGLFCFVPWMLGRLAARRNAARAGGAS
jgi:hypothetical protein